MKRLTVVGMIVVVMLVFTGLSWMDAYSESNTAFKIDGVSYVPYSNSLKPMLSNPPQYGWTVCENLGVGPVPGQPELGDRQKLQLCTRNGWKVNVYCDDPGVTTPPYHTVQCERKLGTSPFQYTCGSEYQLLIQFKIAETPTPVPTNTPTNTATSTETPTPTSTPTNTASPTETPTPTNTLASGQPGGSLDTNCHRCIVSVWNDGDYGASFNFRVLLEGEPIYDSDLAPPSQTGRLEPGQRLEFPYEWNLTTDGIEVEAYILVVSDDENKFETDPPIKRTLDCATPVPTNTKRPKPSKTPEPYVPPETGGSDGIVPAGDLSNAPETAPDYTPFLGFVTLLLAAFGIRKGIMCIKKKS
jgi:hypothetical protein